MTGMEVFLEMGGHGAYIWPAYGLVFAVLAALLIFSRRFAGNASQEFDALNPRTRKNRDSADET
jgi:heme exporter protein CcmD